MDRYDLEKVYGILEVIRTSIDEGEVQTSPSSIIVHIVFNEFINLSPGHKNTEILGPGHLFIQLFLHRK